MVDWAKVAMERLERAEAEVRTAEVELRTEDPSAPTKYSAALRELEFARRFLNRVKSDNEVVEGVGLFG